MPPAPTSILSSRLDRLRESLASASLDALLVTHLPNVFYLTNLAASAGVAVVTMDDVCLAVDSRYLEAARTLLASDGACPGCRLLQIEGSQDEAVGVALTMRPTGRTGFEAHHLTVARHHVLQSGAVGRLPELVATEGTIERARAVKDPHEVAVLREAARMLSGVAVDAIAAVAPGRRERDVAGDIDRAIRAAGFARPAFETIVGSGPNGALPHARPGDRRLAAGDGVVLDFGGVYDGYCVDLTRTVFIGDAGADARGVYEAVAEAHAAAVASVRPGVTAGEVDRAARDTLSLRGLAEAFGHATGHGLGIELHEDPRITARGPAASRRLEAGMVFTIEPGAYLPGRFGVRIEDDVLVTETGSEILTRADRSLRVIG